MENIFFHIDVNSAFLSWTAVSQLNNGSTVDLREVPAIIGGDREKRHGIVLARSIPAKKYGIVTAEPVAQAMKKCPNLLVAAPDFNTYSEMSHKFIDYLHTLTDDIEQASIDECYLFYSPISRFYESPEACADMIRKEIHSRFGFTVNIGISDKKVLAKMASDFTKPNRTHTLYSHEIMKKMWPLSVGDLFLCGKSAAATLNKLGIFTIGDLAQADLNVLTDNLKSHGKLLWEYANGIDDSMVEKTHAEAKGVGNSTTSEHDVTDRAEALNILMSLSESVSRRLNRAGFLASCITVEIKYASFKSYSRQCQVDKPIETSRAIHNVATKLFDELWDREPIRLLGVRATKLTKASDPVQLSLFADGFIALKEKEKDPAQTEQDLTKQIKLEEALASIRNRYGFDSIKRGSDN